MHGRMRSKDKGGFLEPPFVFCPPAHLTAADVEGVDQLFVAIFVFCLQVVQQLPALGDHEEQAAMAVHVLRVALHVFGQFVDALGQNGDVNFRRTGVVLFGLIF